MSTLPLTPHRRAPRRLALAALLVGLLAPVTTVGAPAASAAAAPVVQAPTLGERAVALAAKQKGDPYVFGAAGPSAFDCSGLTQWVYGKLGTELPRNSTAQYSTTYVKRVSHSAKKPGDLIFVHSGGRIFHVGIYAGGGQFWVAPKTGDRVKLQTIWTSSYYVGHVR